MRPRFRPEPTTIVPMESYHPDLLRRHKRSGKASAYLHRAAYNKRRRCGGEKCMGSYNGSRFRWMCLLRSLAVELKRSRGCWSVCVLFRGLSRVLFGSEIIKFFFDDGYERVGVVEGWCWLDRINWSLVKFMSEISVSKYGNVLEVWWILIKLCRDVFEKEYFKIKWRFLYV